MYSAPQPIDGNNAPSSVPDGKAEILQQCLQSQKTVQIKEIKQPDFFIMPPDASYDRGWIMPKHQLNNLKYTGDMQAPDTAFSSSSYSSLIQRATNPPVFGKPVNLPLLRAPGVNEGM